MTAPLLGDQEFIVFGSPEIREAEIDEMMKTLKSGWIGTGPKVQQFEDAMRVYKGAPYAAAVSSCTAAMHLSMVAADIQPGDEVITTAMTFCATVNAIIHAGGTPVLVDCDPMTMNIDPSLIEAKITKKTKAILPVHFAGRSCDMDALGSIVSSYKLKMIEDCAHAIETEWKGQKAGTFGDFGCLSFYVTKNVITGEGGMVLAKNEADISRIKVLALHGMSKDAWARFSDSGYKHYYVTEAGFKYNMTDMQASLGIHQLARVSENRKRREAIWHRYNAAFKDLSIGLPVSIEDDTVHAYHLYTVMVAKEKTGISRDEFLAEMTKKKIGVGVHYLSIPEHPYYQKRFGWKPEEYPHAMKIGRETISLPLSPRLTDENIDRIVAAVTSCLL